MDSIVRQTYVAMFFVIAFFIGFIHFMAYVMCSLAVDQEGFQRIAQVLSYPASFA